MPRPLSLSKAMKLIHEKHGDKLTVNYQACHELLIRVRGSAANTGYYAADPQDAIDTADRMAAGESVGRGVGFDKQGART